MERIVDVAAAVMDRYHVIAGEVIDEMKLHKMIYFCQRESYAVYGRPMFAEKMQGWKYGPVSPVVRANYTTDGMNCDTHAVGNEAAYIVNNIIEQYAAVASWKLSQMSHNELSWRRSREGLSEQDRGSRELLDEDIKEDAKKIRPYDAIYDMYYDEFESVNA